MDLLSMPSLDPEDNSETRRASTTSRCDTKPGQIGKPSSLAAGTENVDVTRSRMLRLHLGSNFGYEKALARELKARTRHRQKAEVNHGSAKAIIWGSWQTTWCVFSHPDLTGVEGPHLHYLGKPQSVTLGLSAYRRELEPSR